MYSSKITLIGISITYAGITNYFIQLGNNLAQLHFRRKIIHQVFKLS